MGAQISTNLCSGREQRYLNIKSKADLGHYINKSTLMVINFTTTWCQPCKDAEPPMRKLAEEVPDVKFARVDIDLLQDELKEFDLKKMPTFLLCKKVDDGLDKGEGAAEAGGGKGSGNGISSANHVKGSSVVPSPKRRTVNYAGKNVFIDEIDRMEGPLDLEGHELRKKIEYYKYQPTTATFKSTDEFYSYLEKSMPTQLMVINFTTESSEPCKKADEPFKGLPNVYMDVKFAKVDVDLDVLKNIAKALDVTKMPTFLLVKVKKLEKEHVKKDGVQGDHKEKKEPPVLNKRYKMVKLAQVVGWDDNKEGELREMIGKHRYTTT